MWHQDYSCETQETQGLRMHPHCPEKKADKAYWICDPLNLLGRSKELLASPNQKHSTILHGKYVHTYYPPVKEGGEDKHTQDAEGQDVEDVGQEHLPFTVQTILTLLITDGPQRRDCWERAVNVMRWKLMKLWNDFDFPWRFGWVKIKLEDVQVPNFRFRFYTKTLFRQFSKPVLEQTSWSVLYPISCYLQVSRPAW